MTTPFTCVVLTFVMIWITRLIVVLAIRRSGVPFDNNHPRKQQAMLEGFPARAVACHNNHLEGFSMFTAAVVVAHLADADPRRAGVLSITFVVTRVIYTVAYLADTDYLRSAIFTIGMLATGGLLVLGWL